MTTKTSEKELRLQYLLSNGSWIDCGDRQNEFLDMCIEFGGVSDRDELVDKLVTGAEIRNDSQDWYSKCRCGNYADELSAKRDKILEERQKKESSKNLYTCSECGQTGHAGNYPFSTISGGNICDDCL